MVVTIEILKTESCPFCPKATEVVNKVAAEFGDKVEVKEIYLDKDEEQKERAKNLGVLAVPTILINGMIRHTGVPREDRLKAEIEQELKQPT